MAYKNHNMSHLWIVRSKYERGYVSFSPILTVLFHHDSLGLVNLEISRFSVDNNDDNDNDRQTDRLLYLLRMHAG